MVSGSRDVTMNDLDIAKALFGEPQYEKDALKPGRTRNYTGTAVTSSENGYVTVRPDGDVISAEDDGTIVIPTTGVVMQDNIVRITSINGSPVTDGSIGWGDAVREDIDGVVAHFWTDSWGAHVSSASNSTEGGNVLIDTDSVDIRDGSTVLASLSSFGSDGGRMTFRGGLEGGGITAHGDASSRTMTISVGRAGDSRAATLNLIANGENGITNIAMNGSSMIAVETPSSGTGVTRDLLGVTDRGNISSQSGGAQAQFSTNGYCATLVLGNDTTPSGQWGSKTLCTIPAGYRPILTSYFPVAKTGVAQSMSYVMINASTGEVTLQNWGGTQSSVNYFCTCTWCY